MKPRLVVAILAALSLVAGTSLAGDYHFGVDLICQDCHVMHASQSHGYNANGTGTFVDPDPAGHHYLLRNNINDLCLSCHDGSNSAPDVFEAHSAGYTRQAGALNVVGGNGLYPPTTGHTLGSTDIAPGGTFTAPAPEGLSCADCHAVHGRASGLTGSPYAAQGGYRNLFRSVTAPATFTSITYTRGDVDGANPGGATAAWVHEDVSSGVASGHYGMSGITFNEPDQAKSRYAEFCKSCHTNFHGDVGGAEIGGTGTPPAEFIRHPMAGVNIGALSGGHSQLARFAGKTSQVQVMSFAGKKAGTYTSTDTDLTPSCFSCHKSHGNQNAFGLIYMLGTSTQASVTEQGDAGGVDARNTCRQCHVQGGTGAW